MLTFSEEFKAVGLESVRHGVRRRQAEVNVSAPDPDTTFCRLWRAGAFGVAIALLGAVGCGPAVGVESDAVALMDQWDSDSASARDSDSDSARDLDSDSARDAPQPETETTEGCTVAPGAGPSSGPPVCVLDFEGALLDRVDYPGQHYASLVIEHAASDRIFFGAVSEDDGGTIWAGRYVEASGWVWSRNYYASEEPPASCAGWAWPCLEDWALGPRVTGGTVIGGRIREWLAAEPYSHWIAKITDDGDVAWQVIHSPRWDSISGCTGAGDQVEPANLMVPLAEGKVLLVGDGTCRNAPSGWTMILDADGMEIQPRLPTQVFGDTGLEYDGMCDGMSLSARLGDETVCVHAPLQPRSLRSLEVMRLNAQGAASHAQLPLGALTGNKRQSYYGDSGWIPADLVATVRGELVLGALRDPDGQAYNTAGISARLFRFSAALELLDSVAVDWPVFDRASGMYLRAAGGSGELVVASIRDSDSDTMDLAGFSPVGAPTWRVQLESDSPFWSPIRFAVDEGGILTGGMGTRTLLASDSPSAGQAPASPQKWRGGYARILIDTNALRVRPHTR
jgi:hypothetical protein